MKTIATATALAASTLALTGTTAIPPVEGPTESAIETLATEREQLDRVTVPVSIGQQGPYRFLVDTGAQATVLSTDLADRLSLTDRSSATLIGMNSRRPVEVAMVPDFRLGRRTMTIRNAPLLERRNIGRADGILGLDSLQDQRVLLDFTTNEILVADSRDLGGDIGYEIVVRAKRKLGQLIITDARIDGQRIAVIVDTGSQMSVGNMALKEKFRSKTTIGDAVLTDVNGVSYGSDVHVARRLSFGKARLHGFPLIYHDSPTFEALGLTDEPAMVLGMRELRVFRRVAIDFKTGRVLFDLPRGARDWNTEPRSRTFGARSG